MDWQYNKDVSKKEREARYQLRQGREQAVEEEHPKAVICIVEAQDKTGHNGSVEKS